MKGKAMIIRGHRAGPVVAMAALACLGLLLTAPFAGAQSRDTGAINGVVTDESGGVLPGATVTLIRPDRGTEATAVTDGRGSYRFPAVRRGTYSVVASMGGFSSARQEDVRLSIGETLRVDFQMQLGSVEETVQVTAIPPLIDVQGSELATTDLSNEVLMNVPTGKDIREIVKLTPGVHATNPDNRGGSFSAFGSSEVGIQYSVDGVLINSPEAGESEVDMGFDSIEEVNILGIGAPAEYGGFDGVVVNLSTKSGSNTIRGLVDVQFQNGQWISENTDDEDLLRSGTERTEQIYHVDVGGPITQDKLWFFGSFRYAYDTSPPDEGFTDGPTGKRPRVIGKISTQVSEKQHFTGMLEYSSLDESNLGSDEGGFFTPGTEFNVVNTEWVWNTNYTNLLSDSTLLEVKFGGHHKRQDEVGVSGDTPGRYDEEFDQVFGNFPFPFTADRERYQLIATVSHYTEDFLGGSHDFKFGADWERSPVHTFAGYAGDKYYIDQGGEPAYLLQGGYDTIATPQRFSVYAQDSWNVNERLRLNLGLRLNRYRGSGFSNRTTEGESGRVTERFDLGTYYEPKIGLAPRLGFTYDVSGDNTAVIKAHVGKYYRQLTALYFSRLLPEDDFSFSFWNGEEYEVEFTETRDLDQFRIDDDLRSPHLWQYAVGFEKELARDLSVDITGIYKRLHDFQDAVNLTGQFVPVQWTDTEFTGNTYTIYDQLNPGENQFLITNVEQGKDYGQAYLPLTDFDQKRTYFGISAALSKRWSNNWQAQGSYNYGRARGNDDNGWSEFGEGRGGNLGSSTFYFNPNWQINATGRLSIDPTHLVKVAASGMFFDGSPAEFTLGTYVNIFSGNPYTNEIPLPGAAEDEEEENGGGGDGGITISPSNQDIYADSKGSSVNPSGIVVDLRWEKSFPIGETRASVYMDIFNLFNVGTTTETANNYQSDRFGRPTDIVFPRRWRFAFRFRF